MTGTHVELGTPRMLQCNLLPISVLCFSAAEENLCGQWWGDLGKPWRNRQAKSW